MSSLITESGLIGADGKLYLPMDRIGLFTGAHRGERVIVKIEAHGRRTTAATMGYYFGYVIPTLRGAMLETGEVMTEDQTHEFFWRLYPGPHDWTQNIRGASQDEVSGYLEWLKQTAAEPPLSVYIEDPKII